MMDDPMLWLLAYLLPYGLACLLAELYTTIETYGGHHATPKD